ncbi:uncharacterized protein LOC141550964 isoform X3 [Sminthopsis crassicaudata]|uniref:uncharacterized protein LOC141550964 isoform X3 n=1 Tax=Sminthopsis crassicaudata TaxID=9301 RepID=UPI003D69DE45
MRFVISLWFSEAFGQQISDSQYNDIEDSWRRVLSLRILEMRLQRSIIMNRLTPQAKSRRWLVTYLLEKNDRNDYLELFLELDQHEVPSANLRFTNGIFCKVKKIQIKGQKRMENKINIELQKRVLNPHSQTQLPSLFLFHSTKIFLLDFIWDFILHLCNANIIVLFAVIYVSILSLCYIVSSMRAENMPYLNFVSTLTASIELFTRTFA